ncbi:MAG: hypothetical protein IPI33_04985 [Dehalococcoidia bacterium]|nr:hypothetical protein [Dehalococcoidia bacterium]
MDHDPHPVERERLRVALSRLLEAFVERDASAEDMNTWAGIVERFGDRIREAPPASVLWGIGNRGVFAVRGILAPAQFTAPAARAGETFSATVVFGADQEGHSGLAHGGSIAQAFDYLFSALDAYGQDMCFTSELSVRFLRPVPLHQSATFEVSLDGIDGALRKASGRASVGGRTCAEATAVLAVKRPR